MGKLKEGNLMGGFEGESDSEYEESDAKRKAIEALKTGNFSPKDRLGGSVVKEKSASVSEGGKGSPGQMQETSSRKKEPISRFKAQVQEGAVVEGDNSPNAVQRTKPSAIVNSVIERKPSGTKQSSFGNWQDSSKIPSSSQTPFKKAPTPISVPSRQAAARTVSVPVPSITRTSI